MWTFGRIEWTGRFKRRICAFYLVLLFLRCAPSRRAFSLSWLAINKVAADSHSETGYADDAAADERHDLRHSAHDAPKIDILTQSTIAFPCQTTSNNSARRFLNKFTPATRWPSSLADWFRIPRLVRDPHQWQIIWILRAQNALTFEYFFLKKYLTAGSFRNFYFHILFPVQ